MEDNVIASSAGPDQSLSTSIIRNKIAKAVLHSYLSSVVSLPRGFSYHTLTTDRTSITTTLQNQIQLQLQYNDAV